VFKKYFCLYRKNQAISLVMLNLVIASLKLLWGLQMSLVLSQLSNTSFPAKKWPEGRKEKVSET